MSAGSRESLADCLPADARILWENYLALHDQGRRKEALAGLEAFVELTTEAPVATQRSFVEAVATYWLDGNVVANADHAGTELHYPLLARLMMPRLREGRAVRRPNYARWLGLALMQHAAGPPALRAGLPAPRDLLDEALVLDADDRIAARAWVEATLKGLEYDFHELPSGLLSPPDEI